MIVIGPRGEPRIAAPVTTTTYPTCPRCGGVLGWESGAAPLCWDQLLSGDWEGLRGQQD